MAENEGTPNPSEENSNRENAPQWARDAISKANNEAAKYRTERNTARDNETAALGEASSLKDSVNAVTAERDSARKDLLKLQTLLDLNLPTEHVSDALSLLQGDTEDELKANAEKIKNLLCSPTNSGSGFDPSQGRGAGSNSPTNPQTALAGFLKGQFEHIKRG